MYSKLTDLESRWKAVNPSELKSSSVSFCQSQPSYNKEQPGAGSPVLRICDNSRCVLSQTVYNALGLPSSPHFISKEDSMEVAGNAVGIDLGKRTYEMCIISRTDRENSLKLAKFLRSHEEDEMPLPAFSTRVLRVCSPSFLRRDCALRARELLIREKPCCVLLRIMRWLVLFSFQRQKE